jgi:hypothetical protein
MTPTIYSLEYEVRPAPHSEDFATAGGAFAICFIRADSAEAARDAALRYFVETAWEVVALERDATVVDPDEIEDEPDALDAYNDALEHGECILLHLWPPEEGDVTRH